MLRMQLELTQLKQDTERRLAEKDEEMEGQRYVYTYMQRLTSNKTLHFRKNFQRQLDAMQQSLDEETKAKNEQTRQRKLIEGQVSDLEGAIEGKEKQVSDQAKNLKKIQAQLKVSEFVLKQCFVHYITISCYYRR